MEMPENTTGQPLWEGTTATSPAARRERLSRRIFQESQLIILNEFALLYPCEAFPHLHNDDFLRLSYLHVCGDVSVWDGRSDESWNDG